MNILFVSDVSISKIIGGAERVLYEQTSRLVKRGYNVHILCRKPQEHDKDYEIISGVHEWRYPINSHNSLTLLWSIRQNAKTLFETLSEKYDFEYINFHQPFSSFGVIQSALSKGIKKVYTCHSLSFEEFISRNPKGKASLKPLFYINLLGRRWMEKSVLRSSDSIVVLSQFTKDKLERVYKIPNSNMSVIPGGIDLERFYPTRDKTDIRQRLQLPKDKTLLFTVRNLVQRMGLNRLIQAFKQVTLAEPDIHLIIGGEGSLENTLKNLTGELNLHQSVTFAGFIEEDDLPDYFRASDLFILPTKELEGFGLVTLEAMASGLAVLGTPVGGTKEIIGKFNPDFLLKDTTSEAMTHLIVKTICKIKDSPEWYNLVSHQCRRFVEDNFSWEQNVDELENLFLSLREKSHT